MLQHTFGQTDFFRCRLKDAPSETPVFNLVKKRPSSFFNLLRRTFVTHFGPQFWKQILKVFCQRIKIPDPKFQIKNPCNHNNGN